MVEQLSSRRSANRDSISTSSLLDDQHGGSERHSPRISAKDNRNSVLTQIGDQSSSSQTIPSWEKSALNYSENSLPNINSPLNSHLTLDSGSEAARKRQRTADIHTSQGSENSRENVQEPAPHLEKRTRVSSHLAARISSGKHTRTFGYLSVQSGGLSRFVGDGFWGLVKGHVSWVSGFWTDGYP